MDFSSEIRARINDALFVFKQPSAAQLNAYTQAKFPTIGRRVKNNMVPAQVKFFDLWITRMENVSADGKPVTVENKQDLPAHVKCQLMSELFDRPFVDTEEDDQGEPVGEDLEGN
jgi:hypothetical protein